MPRIELDLTEEEAEMLTDAVEDVHIDYKMGTDIEEDKEDYRKGLPIAASLIHKLRLSFGNAK